MAAGSWVRSLQCKSMAADDVAAATVTVVPKKPHLLLPGSCASSDDAHKHVSSKPKQRPKAKARAKPATLLLSPPPGPLGPLPALTELPTGHSSRQVVEIIFLSSWSTPPATSGGGSFAGEVEMLFRVHNPPRAVARFEDYRAAVRARAGAAARSAADGNEMMRFSPAPACGAAGSAARGGEDCIRIRTFDGSGGAHANWSEPASGRRAMLLCRVIAGRVKEGSGSDPQPDKEYDSVKVRKGQLVVFDRRAVLPCFLIIYRL